VADVHTVQRARRDVPGQAFLSLAVAPPHLHAPELGDNRRHYEQKLLDAGADRVIPHTGAVLEALIPQLT
jgi:HAD superfamily phosphatase